MLKRLKYDVNEESKYRLDKAKFDKPVMKCRYTIKMRILKLEDKNLIVKLKATTSNTVSDISEC